MPLPFRREEEVDHLPKKKVLQIVEYEGKKYAIHPEVVRTRWGTKTTRLYARRLKKVI